MEQMLNVEKIRAFMARQQPQAHPILGHPLADMEDYVRRQYVDMLCVFAQYENKDTATASNFIARLMAGAGMQEPVTEHIKNAMELTVEKFEEFLHLCEENRFQNIFFLDAILVSCAGGVPEKKQLEFLAMIAETLKTDKANLQKLSRFAYAILMQSKEEFDALRQDFTVGMYNNLIFPFGCYLENVVSGLMVNSEDAFWIHLFKKKPIDLTTYFDGSNGITGVGEIKGKTIILENVELTAPEVSLCKFTTAETVKMKNCSIVNWKFEFLSAKKIELEQCEYTMTNGTDVKIDYLLKISSGNLDSVRMDSCYIHDICTHNGYTGFSLLTTPRNSKIYISFSHFQNIIKTGWGGTILSESIVYLTNCRFANCHGGYSESLFYRCSIQKNQNCKLENCARLHE